MGELNNSIIAMVDQTDCSIVEVIIVLRLIALRLERAFELSVMGNPIASIAERVRHGDNLEKDSLR